MSPNRLLIIDDEVTIGSIIAAAALGAGYDARATITAESFKHEFLTFQPTLIALDLSMPDEDGIQILRFLAESGCTAGILIVSGFDHRVLESATRLGQTRGLRMLGTIPKPFRLIELRKLFDTLRHSEPEPIAPARDEAPKRTRVRVAKRSA
jgi:DNA-binding response OmpR family regulator